MRYRNNETIEIPLRLTDRRGRPIRAAECEDLRIQVWTQDPRAHLVFHIRDVSMEQGIDILKISPFEMTALSPGVVVYRYSFRDHGGEFSQTIVTDLKWKDEPHDRFPGHGSHPGLGHEDTNTLLMLAKIKDDVDRIEKDMSSRVRDLRRYIQEEYPDELRNVESAIWDVLKPLSKNFRSLNGEFRKFVNSYSEDKAQDEEKRKKELESFKEEVRTLRRQAKKVLEDMRISISENTGLINKLKNRQTDHEAALERETLRATNAENILKENIKENRRRLKIIEGDENTPGSIKNALKDSKRYTDESVTELAGAIAPIPRSQIKKWFES